MAHAFTYRLIFAHAEGAPSAWPLALLYLTQKKKKKKKLWNYINIVSDIRR